MVPQIEKEKKTVFYSARIFSLPSLVRISLSIIGEPGGLQSMGSRRVRHD